MHVPTRVGFISTILAGIVIALAGCATRTQDVSRRTLSIGVLEQNVSAALLGGKPAEAREPLAAALRTQPENGYLHLLNGLSYQTEDGSLQSLELAKVGYDAAVKLAPDHFWSHYLAGVLALELKNYAEAAGHFSKAILNDPGRPQAFLGLAISAYFADDQDVAQVAADRALTLGGDDPLALRTVAFVAAARGERGRLEAVLKKARAVPMAALDLDLHKSRLSQLLRTAALEQGPGDSKQQQAKRQPAAVAGPKANENTNQVMIEVTLLLNQDCSVQNAGMNLLDGLTVQFGLENLTQARSAAGAPNSFSKVFTTAIKVPCITYSLNLFNTKSDYYRVVARPSLVAYVGKPSEFFIGSTVNVGVIGPALAALKPIDVGTSVRITPSEITTNHARFRVEITRSFFAAESAGTFPQSLTTFKQTVNATAEVDFGRTLILSALYEGVSSRGSSKTPVLGDVPGVNTFFNSRTSKERRDVALVLVTPRLADSVETDTREFRGDTLNRLLALWKDLVDPASNLDVIVGTIGKKHETSKLFRGRTGDLRLPSVSDPATVRSVVKETLAQIN